MTAMFGPQGANSVTAKPNGTPQQRYGGNQTWVKDCTAPGASDGTVLDAAFYNRIIGALDYLLGASGVTALPGDDSALYRAVLQMIAGIAPDSLNTLKELADALGDDPNFSATMMRLLGTCVRFDQAQALTALQQLQALTNLGLTARVAQTNQYSDLNGLPTLGTAASKDAGTSANQVLLLDPSGRIPAIDGSNITGLTVAGAVRFDVAQGLTSPQRDQTRVNAAAIGIIRRTVFTANGTWTPNANMLYADIEAVGGGGAGGGIQAISTAVGSGAGGGQSGAYSRSTISAATAGATQAVTVGAGGTGVAGSNGNTGGDTSVGTLVVAKGGVGALGVAPGSQSTGRSGDNSTAGTGDLKVNGGSGSAGLGGNVQVCLGGSGGASYFGGGGTGQVASGSGVSGLAYGSGGGGAAGINGAVASTGGNGAAGLVIITEYCTK